MPIIVQGLPEKPHLPNPPTTQDQVFLWSGALNRALYDILSQIARKVNSRVFDGNVDFGGYNLTNIGTITAGTGNITTVNATTITATTGNFTTIVPTNITGTTTNNNASAGSVGQYIESIIVSGSAVAVVTATAKTVTSISLTAGDWDVDGIISYLPANTTNVTAFVGSYALVTNTLDVTPGRVVAPPMAAKVFDGTTAVHAPMPHYRFSLAATTTVFLIAFSTFTVSTNVAYGMIRARRVR